jgi:MoxR-like ATPase
VTTSSTKTNAAHCPTCGRAHELHHDAVQRRERQAVYTVTMTEETPAAELRGFYMPNGHGGFDWHHGPGITAWLDGARLAVNEVDKASDDAKTLLYALLDDPDFARLTLPTDDTVRPAPGFSVVGTTNALPDVLPDALRDRFPVRILIDEVHPDALLKLPDYMRLAARETTKLALDDARRVSLREWYAFAELVGKLGDERAADVMFGDRAFAVLDALTLARDSGGHAESATLAMPKCWERAAAAVSAVSRVLLYGPPGTGKTFCAVTLGVKS